MSWNYFSVFIYFFFCLWLHLNLHYLSSLCLLYRISSKKSLNFVIIYTEILCMHMTIQKKWVGYLTFSCLYMYMVLNCCISFWLGSFFMSWSISSAMCLGRIESSRRSCWRASETIAYNIKLRIIFTFMQH